jgi:hypothetical protein
MAEDIPPPAEPAKETPMEFHKPKPVHNWRDFFKEIGVIVLGVSIALAAEQAVEWFHWRNQVQAAREVIATELAGSVADAIGRLRIEGCAERRLDTLAQILDTAAKSGALPPVGIIGATGYRQYPNGAWQGLIASQAATHFPRQQLADLAVVYGYVNKADEFSQTETTVWTDLDSMVGPGRRLDPPSEDRLRAALGQARSYNRSITLLGVRIIQRVQKMGIVFGKDDLDRIAQARTRPISNPICRPIGAVPAGYGEGTLAGSMPEINAMAKKLPEFGVH